MELIGHRGVAALEPENTLRSVRRALRFGLGMVEIDVRWAGCHLWVLHDHRLDRTTNLRGALTAYGFGQLRTADAGAGERIPLLREVIEVINRRAVLNIELKGPRTALPVVALLDELCEGAFSPSDFLLSSFSPRELAVAKRVGPHYPRALLVGSRPLSVLKTARQLQVGAIHLSRKRAVSATVRVCGEAGYGVRVFTVNDAQEASALQAMGVEGVFTDDPTVFGCVEGV